MRSTAWIAVATASLVGAVASSWPMMLRPWSHLPGIPGAEVADHLWSLWVALESGPIVVRDAWINAPQGFNWVVADPGTVAVVAIDTDPGSGANGSATLHPVWVLVLGACTLLAQRCRRRRQ